MLRLLTDNLMTVLVVDVVTYASLVVQFAMATQSHCIRT